MPYRELTTGSYFLYQHRVCRKTTEAHPDDSKTVKTFFRALDNIMVMHVEKDQ